jgi:hypothetical protein
MKKFPLTLIILFILALFVAADYFLNNLDSEVALEDIKKPQVSADEKKDDEAGFIDAFYKLNDDVLGYKVMSQVQTNQIFEKIDLNSINNIKIYRNRLEKAKSESSSETIYLYEAHGPKNQGSLTYLHVKLQFIAQINGTTETINEVGTFGHNSFFFNDDNHKNTAFLLTQINDDLYGFQFNKTDPTTGEDSNTYEDVKKMITNLMPTTQPNNSPPTT